MDPLIHLPLELVWEIFRFVSDADLVFNCAWISKAWYRAIRSYHRAYKLSGKITDNMIDGLNIDTIIAAPESSFRFSETLRVLSLGRFNHTKSLTRLNNLEEYYGPGYPDIMTDLAGLPKLLTVFVYLQAHHHPDVHSLLASLATRADPVRVAEPVPEIVHPIDWTQKDNGDWLTPDIPIGSTVVTGTKIPGEQGRIMIVSAGNIIDQYSLDWYPGEQIAISLNTFNDMLHRTQLVIRGLSDVRVRSERLNEYFDPIGDTPCVYHQWQRNQETHGPIELYFNNVVDAVDVAGPPAAAAVSNGPRTWLLSAAAQQRGIVHLPLLCTNVSRIDCLQLHTPFNYSDPLQARALTHNIMVAWWTCIGLKYVA